MFQKWTITTEQNIELRTKLQQGQPKVKASHDMPLNSILHSVMQLLYKAGYHLTGELFIKAGGTLQTILNQNG